MLFKRNKPKDDFKPDIDMMVLKITQLKKEIDKLEDEMVAFIGKELPIVLEEINENYDMKERFEVPYSAERCPETKGKYWNICSYSEKGAVVRLRLTLLGTEKLIVPHGLKLSTWRQGGEETLVAKVSAQGLRHIFALHLHSMGIKEKELI